MNRIIEFRGKPVDKFGRADWLYGDLIQNKSYNLKKGFCLIRDQKTGEEYEVVPETIGQYINKWDVKDRDAYEGDIVKFSGYGHEEGTIGIIKYDEVDMSFHITNCVDRDINEHFSGVCEIIGNIHDNPDLIK
jgi:hypothetical protein